MKCAGISVLVFAVIVKTGNALPTHLAGLNADSMAETDEEGQDEEADVHHMEEGDMDMDDEEEMKKMLRTNDDEEQIKDLLEQMDTDKNGQIALSELKDYGRKIAAEVAKEAVDNLWRESGLTPDGKISLSEHLSETRGASSVTRDPDNNPEDRAHMEDRVKLETEKFRAADENSDGVLDQNEALSLFFLHKNDAVLTVQLRHIMKNCDANEDGTITPQEFLELGHELFLGLWSSWDHDESKEFKRLDVDKDGILTLQEMKHFHDGEYHAKESMEQVFSESDADQNGHITVDELLKAYQEDGEEKQTKFANEIISYWIMRREPDEGEL